MTAGCSAVPCAQLLQSLKTAHRPGSGLTLWTSQLIPIHLPDLTYAKYRNPGIPNFDHVSLNHHPLRGRAGSSYNSEFSLFTCAAGVSSSSLLLEALLALRIGPVLSLSLMSDVLQPSDCGALSQTRAARSNTWHKANCHRC